MRIRVPTTSSPKYVHIEGIHLWRLVATVAFILGAISIVTIHHFPLPAKLGCIAGALIIYGMLVAIPEGF